jgi:hypothetical protein
MLPLLEATVHAGSRLTGSVKGRVLSHVNNHATDGNNNVDLEGKPEVRGAGSKAS